MFTALLRFFAVGDGAGGQGQRLLACLGGGVDKRFGQVVAGSAPPSVETRPASNLPTTRRDFRPWNSICLDLQSGCIGVESLE